jgi:hypothetical protein
VKVRHAGENRHPGSFADPVSKIAWIPASAGMTGKVKLVNKFTTPALRAKVRSVNYGETE